MNDKDINEEIRMLHIAELKDQAKELGGGEMLEGQAEECTPELEECFWQNVVNFERAPEATHRELLKRNGFICTPPEEIDDTHICEALHDLIQALAQRRVYLNFTDHLSDRELYQKIWAEMLDETTIDFPPEAEMNCRWDMAGGDDGDNTVYLKYYASEDDRQHWVESFPEDPLPVHEDPPYDRDRFLPCPERDDPRYRGEV
jgi:hypothetical protein